MNRKNKKRLKKLQAALLRRGEEGSGIAPKTEGPSAPADAPGQELPPIEGPGRAMVIVAHPDDAEFLCGGTVAKWCAEGWDVFYVLVTSGDKGTHDPTMHPEKLAATREEEQRAACRVLGVKEVILLGYPDGFTVDEQELRGQIVRLLRLYRPDVVITWDAFRHSFNHRDHRNVGTVTADAIYPLVRDRLFYPQHEEDGLESHQVNEILLAGTDNPDYVVDITDHWETKVDAILCHTSQIGGRTREDFVRDRRERDEREGSPRIEEKFRRWSIRMPARPQAKDDAAKAEAEKEQPATNGAGGDAPGGVLVGGQKGQKAW
ncbi:MAG: PIG-L family deacetylase [Dehalococcoidia bacterium]|nr:PIG-L family deacetylase [Dehalococcoidia bacterium]